MLDSIKIEKFKKIQSEYWLTLDNLAKVNYLVWENGCGKSSILEWIYVRYKEIEYKNFPEMNIIFDQWRNITIKPLLLVHNNNILNSNFEVNNSRNLKLNSKDSNNIYLDQSEIVEYSHLELLNITFNWYSREINFSQKLKDKIIEFFNIFFEKQYKIIDIKKQIWNPENWETSLQFYITDEEWNDINLNFIAWWYIYFIKLLVILSLDIYSSYDIICIEEPEQQLNPKIQKLIPFFLNFMCTKNDNLHFFISTHSPFIISAASKFDNQKVYLIENGETIDVLWNKSSKEANDWYLWWAALLSTHYMLWSQLSDFYPEKIIFCENSLMVLLKKYCQKFSLAMPQFFYTRWDNDTISKTDLFLHMKSALEWPNGLLFWKSIIWVIDKLNESEQKNKTYPLLKDKIVILKNITWEEAEELEQLYPKELVNNFIKENFENYKYLLVNDQVLTSDRVDWKFKDHFLGILKNKVEKAEYDDAVLWILKEKLAIYIIEKIDKKEDIRTRFSNIDEIL